MKQCLWKLLGVALVLLVVWQPVWASSAEPDALLECFRTTPDFVLNSEGKVVIPLGWVFNVDIEDVQLRSNQKPGAPAGATLINWAYTTPGGQPQLALEVNGAQRNQLYLVTLVYKSTDSPARGWLQVFIGANGTVITQSYEWCRYSILYPIHIHGLVDPDPVVINHFDIILPQGADIDSKVGAVTLSPAATAEVTVSFLGAFVMLHSHTGWERGEIRLITIQVEGAAHPIRLFVRMANSWLYLPTIYAPAE